MSLLLKEKEKELAELMKNDSSNWAKFYVVMKSIQDQELWRELEYRSFTAWVKDFALKNKIFESTIWNKFKAGKVYEQFREKKLEEGVELDDITSVKVSADSLVLADKIKKITPDKGEEYMEKLIAGDMKRSDLRTAYKVLKDKQKQYAVAPIKRGRPSAKDKELKEEIEIQAKTTALDIIKVMETPSWLTGLETIKHRSFVTREEKDKYKALPEFRVFTGTTTKSRRMDVVAVENITVENALHEINLHGVEIKVDQYDLLNDYKYTEYADFVNYLWVAVPTELIEIADENVPKSIGILEYIDGNISRYREAERLEARRLNESYQVLALKLL